MKKKTYNRSKIKAQNIKIWTSNEGNYQSEMEKKKNTDNDHWKLDIAEKKVT